MVQRLVLHGVTSQHQNADGIDEVVVRDAIGQTLPGLRRLAAVPGLLAGTVAGPPSRLSSSLRVWQSTGS